MRLTLKPYTKRDGALMVYLNASSGAASLGISAEFQPSAYGVQRPRGRKVTKGQRNMIDAYFRVIKAMPGIPVSDGFDSADKRFDGGRYGRFWMVADTLFISRGDKVYDADDFSDYEVVDERVIDVRSSQGDAEAAATGRIEVSDESRGAVVIELRRGDGPSGTACEVTDWFYRDGRPFVDNRYRIARVFKATRDGVVTHYTAPSDYGLIHSVHQATRRDRGLRIIACGRAATAALELSTAGIDGDMLEFDAERDAIDAAKRLIAQGERALSAIGDRS